MYIVTSPYTVTEFLYKHDFFVIELELNAGGLQA